MSHCRWSLVATHDLRLTTRDLRLTAPRSLLPAHPVPGSQPIISQRLIDGAGSALEPSTCALLFSSCIAPCRGGWVEYGTTRHPGTGARARWHLVRERRNPYLPLPLLPSLSRGCTRVLARHFSSLSADFELPVAHYTTTHDAPPTSLISRILIPNSVCCSMDKVGQYLQDQHEISSSPHVMEFRPRGHGVLCRSSLVNNVFFRHVSVTWSHVADHFPALRFYSGLSQLCDPQCPHPRLDPSYHSRQGHPKGHRVVFARVRGAIYTPPHRDLPNY